MRGALEGGGGILFLHSFMTKQTMHVSLYTYTSLEENAHSD